MRAFITSLYPTPDPDYDKRHRYVAWFLTTFTIVLIFIILSTIVIAVSNYKSDLTVPNTFTLVGMSLLVGATGFAGGGFLGFIFGVPKVRTLDEGVANREVASNTNLEQVSDWLTKIIVGVSLVQFDGIVDALSGFSAAVDSAMAGKNTDLGGAGFIASLILVGSAIAGFLAAYLKSKTDLMDAFAPLVEVRSNFGEAVADQLIGQVGRGVLNLPDMEVDKCARDASAKLIQIIPSKSDDPKMHEMAGLSHAILKNFAASADALKRAFDLRPAGSTSDLGALAARAYALAGNASKARQVSQQAYSASDLSSSDDDARVAAREAKLADLFTSLYARGGYEHVIETGKQLLSDPGMQSSSRLWLYLACAYGQRQSALIQENKDPDQLAMNRADALYALNKAVSLDPNGNKQTLRMLIDPTNKTKSVEENDLEIFYDDWEFRSALGVEG